MCINIYVGGKLQLFSWCMFESNGDVDDAVDDVMMMTVMLMMIMMVMMMKTYLALHC